MKDAVFINNQVRLVEIATPNLRGNQQFEVVFFFPRNIRP